MYPTYFKVETFNIATEKLEIEEGLIYSDNFVSAMKKIEDYYGDDLNKVEIKLFQDGLIILPSEIMKPVYDYLESEEQ